MFDKTPRIEHFQFRDLHPNVFMGTASDRYAGWIGQIYSGRRYAGRITRRTKKVGGRGFAEEVLPVESVEEYFRHFRVLELDFTFYSPLLDEDGRPGRNLHVLRSYSRYLEKDARLILKVPQAVFARRIHRGGRHVLNEQYLDPEIFTQRFYEPALGQLAPWIGGFLFEQEYQRKQDRLSPEEFAAELDAFFQAIPNDGRYHVEIRTDEFLAPPVFEVLDARGVGQVLSHWTWLPELARQFSLSGGKFLNRNRHSIIRLMTPRGMRYQEAYAKAHPFNSIVDGMLDPLMIEQTVDIMNAAVQEDVQISVVVNNRAGGNAPLIALNLAEKFLARIREFA